MYFIEPFWILSEMIHIQPLGQNIRLALAIFYDHGCDHHIVLRGGRWLESIVWDHPFPCIWKALSLHLFYHLPGGWFSFFHIKVFSASSERSPSLHTNTFQVSAASHFLMSRWPKQITWPRPETSRGNELHLFRWEAATYRAVFPFSLPQIVSNK